MRFAIDMPAFGGFDDPEFLIEAARLAEASGWDGVHLWDHINWPYDAPRPTSDAFLCLAALALATERIQLGVMVSPLPRRQPHEVARVASTLHRLSGGRFMLGVGSGGGREHDAAEFAAFGLAEDARTRGEQLDEALEVVLALWSGEPVHHRGPHYTADGVTFLPATPWSATDPAIPIWVGGFWGRPKPLRRAARFNAYAPIRAESKHWLPADVATARERLAAVEAGPHQPAIVFGGGTGRSDAGRLDDLAGAGLDWWSEVLTPWDGDRDIALARIAAGPVIR